MNPDRIKNLLERYKAGDLTLPEAMGELKDFPFKDLDYARLDTHRELRTGQPEVVYCAGKTAEQLRGILEHLVGEGSAILATRAGQSHFEAVRGLSPLLRFDPVSRTITLPRPRSGNPPSSYIAVVTAGTSDIPVAEEAAVTAETFGRRVERVFDVGVAGIHRLFHRLELIRGARVVVAVAGMEGALPSVLGGLVESPVIAVPTSIGYGASFQGLSALLTMLNSCAAGIAVVNIDNGFGAGYLAAKIDGMGA
jgi:pyridinium-3,5-biscarboxylic acid mononucleotide synthase